MDNEHLLSDILTGLVQEQLPDNVVLHVDVEEADGGIVPSYTNLQVLLKEPPVGDPPPISEALQPHMHTLGLSESFVITYYVYGGTIH